MPEPDMTVESSPDVPAVGSWQDAEVVGIRPETARVKTFRLALTQPSGHMAGQHYLVRLTAPDGYTAQRSYSVASAPEAAPEIELTVERLPDGEVSTFLHDELVVGDNLEVRGPIGGWFVWDGTTPALLLGGGSGVVPLRAMLQLARLAPDQHLVHLVVSVRTPEDLIYAGEMTGSDVTVIYTRETPLGTARPAGRVTLDDIRPLSSGGTRGFVCGSTSFAEAASLLLLDAGVGAGMIRVERFGPTG
jgi:ferredoxin-NADP reductase